MITLVFLLYFDVCQRMNVIGHIERLNVNVCGKGNYKSHLFAFVIGLRFCIILWFHFDSFSKSFNDFHSDNTNIRTEHKKKLVKLTHFLSGYGNNRQTNYNNHTNRCIRNVNSVFTSIEHTKYILNRTMCLKRLHTKLLICAAQYTKCNKRHTKNGENLSAKNGFEIAIDCFPKVQIWCYIWAHNLIRTKRNKREKSSHMRAKCWELCAPIHRVRYIAWWKHAFDVVYD